MFKTCCFLGHRKIDIDILKLKKDLLSLIKNLILNENVGIFLFGSRSDFIDICYEIVTELKIKFPFIKRIAYDCKHEKSCLKEEAEKMEAIYLKLHEKKVHINDYEEVQDSYSSFQAGKNSYNARNHEMIDKSDIIVFYFDENYLPPRRKQYKNDWYGYQPNSGTALSYKYAKQKKKKIINMFKTASQ